MARVFIAQSSSTWYSTSAFALELFQLSLRLLADVFAQDLARACLRDRRNDLDTPAQTFVPSDASSGPFLNLTLKLIEVL